MNDDVEPADPTREHQHAESADGAPELSLTDFLDEMERAAFRRSLAGRDALVSAYGGDPGSD